MAPSTGSPTRCPVATAQSQSPASSSAPSALKPPIGSPAKNPAMGSPAVNTRTGVLPGQVIAVGVVVPERRERFLLLREGDAAAAGQTGDGTSRSIVLRTNPVWVSQMTPPPLWRRAGSIRLRGRRRGGCVPPGSTQVEAIADVDRRSTERSTVRTTRAVSGSTISTASRPSPPPRPRSPPRGPTVPPPGTPGSGAGAARWPTSGRHRLPDADEPALPAEGDRRDVLGAGHLDGARRRRRAATGPPAARARPSRGSDRRD